jgi:hypothetical protein
MTRVISAVAERQGIFMKYINGYYGGRRPSMQPLGRPGSFCPPTQGLSSFWYGVRVWDLTCWAVATQLAECNPREIVIDHAWLFGSVYEPHEPFGMVTEPYITQDSAKRIADLANEAMAVWGIDVHVLSEAYSTWNPGQCSPLIAFGRDGGCQNLMRHSIPWLLGREGD